MKFIKPIWPAPKHINAYTTSRLGWDDLKRKDECFHTPPSQASQDLVNLLNLPQEPIWINQKHSTKVIEAVPANLGCEADASYSDSLNQVCIVLTADCLPVLICTRTGAHVAAVHAGWRGLAAGILEETIRKLNQPKDQLLVWLGPAIGPNKFEVGKDVFDAFFDQDPESTSAFSPFKEGKWLANLYQLATIRLNKMGISQIYGGNFCTFTNESLFYSYRRDNKKTGRMASLIWIANK